MDNKLRFSNTLASLVEYASANGNTLTQKKVADAFSDIVEDKSAYDTIYDYLESKKITIKGYKKADGKINEFAPADEPDLSNIETDSEAAAFIKMYKRDLRSVSPLGTSEKDILIKKNLIRRRQRKSETHRDPSCICT